MRRGTDTGQEGFHGPPNGKRLDSLYFVAKGLMSLLKRTRTGLKELPSNAAWLMSRALRPLDSIEETVAGARDQGRRIEAAVIDAAPLGGDSVETRIRRAQEAAERAREAEEEAKEAAREAKASAENVRRVSDRGRTRVYEAEQQADRAVKQRVAKAEKAAEEFVRRERRAAEADAKEQRREIAEEVEKDIGEAQREAEESREVAEELVADASDKLAEAARLADEAAEAARGAAEVSQRQARELAGHAERQASEAGKKVETTEELREQLVTTAKATAHALNRDTTNGLSSYNKPELVELAAGMGIRGRSSMTKAELVSALRRATRGQAGGART